MNVKIINKSDNPLPSYSTEWSSGMDLRANLKESITLNSLERTLVPTGLYIELPEGYEAQIRPRSGLALKKGLSVLNSPGTIDADYRGEIGIILVNLSKDPVEITPGERICQMVISSFEHVKLTEVEEINETPRSAGGFGHTGSH
jgi:dUTP pyrophosphatase